MPPSGITQRAQWMQKFSVYKQNYLDALESYLESRSPRSPSNDGMPHGNSVSDVVSRTSERAEKANRKLRYAKDALDTAKRKRIMAMEPLGADQKLVLTAIYLHGKSRRAVAKEQNKSDFWVRAQERTGLFQLALPSGWENDILP